MHTCIFYQGICEENNSLKPLYEADMLCMPICHNIVQAQVVAELSHRFVTGKTATRCNKLAKKECLSEAELSQNTSWSSTESDCKWLQGSEYFNNTEHGICSVKALTIPIALSTTQVILKAFFDISKNYKQSPMTLIAGCLETQGGEKECQMMENCEWCPFTSFFTTPNIGKGICVPDDKKQQKEPGLSFCSLVNAGNSSLKSPFDLSYPYSTVRTFYNLSSKMVKKKLSQHVLSLDELVQLDDSEEDDEIPSNATASKFLRNLPLDDPKAEPDSVLYVKRVIDSLFQI